MAEQPQLIIRNSVRHDVSLRASISIGAQDGGVVRFSAASGDRDGWVDVDVIDFSSGGFGMMSGVFIPRKTVLAIRIFGLDANAPPIITCPVRVQRVCMTDRRPAYLIGTSLENPPPESIAQIDRVLAALSGVEPLCVTPGA